MASEKLTIELWEIIQKNNKEEISYNDFENDLNKAFNLPKDEVDRALAIMISQAEVNPNIIGEYRDGSFMISQSFAAIVASTIKYENQFIPGKQEYIARELGKKTITDLSALTVSLLTPEVLDKMINDYDKLSDVEQNLLWKSYSIMNYNQRKEMDKAFDEDLAQKQNAKDTPPEEQEKIANTRNENKTEGAIIEAAIAGNEIAIKLLRKYFNDMKKNNSKKFELFFNAGDIDFFSIDNESIIKLATAYRGINQYIQKQVLIEEENIAYFYVVDLSCNGNSIECNQSSKNFVRAEDYGNLEKNSLIYKELAKEESIIDECVEKLTKMTMQVGGKDEVYDFLESFLKSLHLEEIRGMEDFLSKIKYALYEYKGISLEDREIIVENIKKSSVSIWTAVAAMGKDEYIETVIAQAKTKDVELSKDQLNGTEQEETSNKVDFEKKTKTLSGDISRKEVIPEKCIKEVFNKTSDELIFDADEYARLEEMYEKMLKIQAEESARSTEELQSKMIENNSSLENEEVSSIQLIKEDEETVEVGESKKSKKADIQSEILGRSEDEIVVTTGEDLFASMDDMFWGINSEYSMWDSNGVALEESLQPTEKVENTEIQSSSTIDVEMQEQIEEDGKEEVFVDPINSIMRKVKDTRSGSIKQAQQELAVLTTLEKNQNKGKEDIEEDTQIQE